MNAKPLSEGDCLARNARRNERLRLAPLQVAEGTALRRRFFSSHIKQAHDVALDGTVTVQKGALKVWIEDKDNARHEVTVQAGTPVRLTGRPCAERSASSDDTTFSINVQAVGGRAEGVTVDFEYHVGD